MNSRRRVKLTVMPKQIPRTVVNCFRLFGVLTLLVFMGILGAFVVTAHLFPKPATFVYVRLSLSTIFGTFLAIGLLLLRKWAAIIFSAVSFAMGVWMIVGSFLYWPFPEMLFILLIGLSFIIPLALTILYWPHLKWRGRIAI